MSASLAASLSKLSSVGDTLYDRVGGQEWFDALVGRFYEGVESDPVLRPLYPKDIAGSRTHLGLFLAQYFGGPRRYDALRGHPRLRLRHAGFVVGAAEHDAWLAHMTSAVRAGGLAPRDEADVLEYFASAAAMLRNDETDKALADRPSAVRSRALKLVPPD